LRGGIQRLQGRAQRLHFVAQPRVGPGALRRVQRDAPGIAGGCPEKEVNRIHVRLLGSCYCTLRPAVVTTLPHLSISLSMNFCKVAGVLGSAGSTKPAAA